jgi:alpha-D-ribose 1-methylphosphonate 5-triphosphate synthase subunit PhnH
MSEAAASGGGFADPAIDAASVFRALLEAMARPGRIERLPSLLAAPPALGAAATQLCLTLCDLDTPLWIDPVHATEESAAYLRFHAGCPLVSRIEDAAFLLVAPANVAQALERCRIGTAEYPDRSATLIIPLDTMSDTGGVRLSGPGIKTEHRLSIAPEPPDFWPALIANHQRFPLGADCFLVAPSQVAGLPRSTMIDHAETG